MKKHINLSIVVPDTPEYVQNKYDTEFVCKSNRFYSILYKFIIFFHWIYRTKDWFLKTCFRIEDMLLSTEWYWERDVCLIWISHCVWIMSKSTCFFHILLQFYSLSIKCRHYSQYHYKCWEFMCDWDVNHKYVFCNHDQLWSC